MNGIESSPCPHHHYKVRVVCVPGWCVRVEPQSDRRRRPVPCGRMGEHGSRTRSDPLLSPPAPPTSDRASQFPCTTSSTPGGISRKLYRNTSDGRRQARRDTTAGACGGVRWRGYSHQAGALSCFSWSFYTLPHQSLSWSASQSASRFVPPHQPNRQTCPLICPIPTAKRFLAQLSWNAISSPRPPSPSMLGISVLFCRRCVRGHST